MVKKDAHGVYSIFKSMEVGPTFRLVVPKYPTKDANYRILATTGPIVMRVASVFPFRTTYDLSGHNFIEHQLRHGKIGPQERQRLCGS